MINKFILSFFFTFNLYALTGVACSHPEVCHLVSELTNNKLNPENLVITIGDPHEFEPSSEQIKNLLSTKILITGPLELNPWIKKILYQRSKNPNLINFTLDINNTLANKYNNNREALSHFWLYPTLLCDMKKQLANWDYFNKNKIAVNASCDSQKILNLLEATLLKIKKPVVLTHDALFPLLKIHSNNQLSVISLKGSGHHDEVSPNAVKELYAALKMPSVIWIFEKNIDVPANLLSKVRPADKQIKIDTGINPSTANLNNSFPTLNQLIIELNRE